MIDGDYSAVSNDMLSLRKRRKKKTFLDNVKITGNGSDKFKDKKISININY